MLHLMLFNLLCSLRFSSYHLIFSWGGEQNISWCENLSQVNGFKIVRLVAICNGPKRIISASGGLGLGLGLGPLHYTTTCLMIHHKCHRYA